MNTKKSLILIAVAAIGIFSAAPRALAVPITFSGGSGTPLSLSLAAPISYTINATLNPTLATSGPVFIIQNTGNLSFNNLSFSSSITFSINAGPAQTLSFASSGFSGGVITGNDLFFYGSVFGLNVGDVVTLTTGTWTTNNNVAAAAPASGSYTTFITDSFGNLISTNGISGPSVPESLSGLWLALPVMGMMAMRRRRTRLPA